MQRPVLIILIGTILGILWGLYFKSITLIFLVFLLLLCIANNHKNIRRYVNIFINKKCLIIIFISILISNLYFNIRKKAFDNMYNLLQKSNYVIGKIVSNRRR